MRSCARAAMWRRCTRRSWKVGRVRPSSSTCARARDRSIVRIGLHEGRKRQVRRMLAAIGHPVLALHRDAFGPVELGGLPRGERRVLEPAEVQALERAAGR